MFHYCHSQFVPGLEKANRKKRKKEKKEEQLQEYKEGGKEETIQIKNEEEQER